MTTFCAPATPVSVTRAVMPTRTTAMAPASATATIFRCVVRSAPISECDMVSACEFRCVSQGRTALSISDIGVRLFPNYFCPARAGGAVALQAVEMHADVRGFGGRIGKRNRLIEGDARLLVAAELHQKAALDAEEMEIARKLGRQRLDHVERGLRTVDFGHCHGPIERDHRRGLQA